MINQSMLSTGPGEWETPQDFFDRLDAEFNFALDAAATPQNAKCVMYYTKEDDALVKPWISDGNVWCNPPYGREIVHFVERGFMEANRWRSKAVVMLLPARTDTKWWHEYVMRADEIRFVRGRLRFVGAKSSAPFPSAVVIFRPGIRNLKVGAMKA